MKKHKATGYGSKGNKIYDANEKGAGSGHNADILSDVKSKKDLKGWLD